MSKRPRQGAVLDVPKGMYERVESFFHNLRGEREYVLTPGDSSSDMAQRCAAALRLPKDTAERAVHALNVFTDKMGAIESVEAVSFLASRVADCPTTLTIEVLTPLKKGDKTTAVTVDSVTEAKAALRRHLAPVIPSGLRFVNTARMNVEALKPRLRKRWAEDPTKELLALVMFRRS